MPKLSKYVEMAATEYLQETGKDELDLHWVSEFFQINGIHEEYPQQDLVLFYSMVQKELTKMSERAEKQSRAQLDKIIQSIKKQGKP